MQNLLHTSKQSQSDPDYLRATDSTEKEERGTATSHLLITYMKARDLVFSLDWASADDDGTPREKSSGSLADSRIQCCDSDDMLVEPTGALTPQQHQVLAAVDQSFPGQELDGRKALTDELLDLMTTRLVQKEHGVIQVVGAIHTNLILTHEEVTTEILQLAQPHFFVVNSDYLFGGIHWAAVLVVPERRYFVFDSLRGFVGTRNNIRKLLQLVLGHDITGEDVDRHTIAIPRQSSNWECGYCVCTVLHRLLALEREAKGCFASHETLQLGFTNQCRFDCATFREIRNELFPEFASVPRSVSFSCWRRHSSLRKAKEDMQGLVTGEPTLSQQLIIVAFDMDVRQRKTYFVTTQEELSLVSLQGKRNYSNYQFAYEVLSEEIGWMRLYYDAECYREFNPDKSAETLREILHEYIQRAFRELRPDLDESCQILVENCHRQEKISFHGKISASCGIVRSMADQRAFWKRVEALILEDIGRDSNPVIQERAKYLLVKRSPDKEVLFLDMAVYGTNQLMRMAGSSMLLSSLLHALAPLIHQVNTLPQLEEPSISSFQKAVPIEQN
jgi:hypothetical protein